MRHFFMSKSFILLLSLSPYRHIKSWTRFYCSTWLYPDCPLNPLESHNCRPIRHQVPASFCRNRSSRVFVYV